ncbi:MAG: YitT family protein [Clostridia bacterium]|nr:YitT family protein [Clostridia bacterium]
MAKNNRNGKILLLDGLFLLLGSLCYALAVDMFSAPNNIAPGGVTGIATMLNYISVHHFPFEIPIGLATVAMNIPLLIAAWVVIGHRLVWRTLVGLGMSSLLIDLLEPIIPPFQGENILTCIFGGVLLGLGVGLILSRGGTTGGSEIVARLLERRFPHIQMGKLILSVDAVVIVSSALVYQQLESPLFAVVLVFVSSMVTDWVIYGGRHGKMAMILSKKQPEVTAAIMERINRGVTLLKAEGAYSGADQKMILCAVRRDETFRLRQLVFEIDPDAFFMMLSTDEVRGYRWLDPHEN